MTIERAILVAIVATVLAVVARQDQASFRRAWEQVPPAKRVVFGSYDESLRYRGEAGDRGVFFVPNDTRQWWQFWRPAYRPVYWSVSK